MTKLEALIARIDAELPYDAGDRCVACQEVEGQCSGCRRTALLRDCREALVNGVPLGRVTASVGDIVRIRYIPGAPQ
jgi:hypothetical protein